MGYKKVFISYSHADEEMLKGLKRHFKLLENKVDFWDDSKILPGSKWEEEIFEALTSAEIAILMISADFLNSNFISQKELPYLLEEAKKNRITILTVLLKPVLFELIPEINQYQAINSPERTILDMTESEREQTWLKLLRRINELTT